MTLRSLPLLAAGAALALAACGGSSKSDTSASSPAPAKTASSNADSGAYGAPAATSTPAASSGSATTVKLAKGDQGSFLVDSSGRALYLWEADKSDKSTCSGACASAWPPLTTSGKPAAGSGVKAALLGTTKRDDGSLEVTYKGHPLYYFAGDQSAGQTNGQGSDGFGAKWYLVKSSGSAIDDD
jgi:predicted lipoprotein with Yx(FWY)xxD motif